MYKDEIAVVKILDNIEDTKINKGVREICVLSLIIFNAYI